MIIQYVNNQTPRIQFSLLIAVSLMAWTIIYFYSLLPTIELYTHQKELTKKKNLMEHQLNELSKSNERNHDKIYNQSSITSAQTSLLFLLKQLEKEHGILLEHLEEPYLERMGDQSILSLNFRLSGDFHSLVKSINEVETSSSGIYIQSIRCEKQFNRVLRSHVIISDLKCKSILI